MMTVDPELKKLDMLDALSERHGALRNIVENKANDKNGYTTPVQNGISWQNYT